MERGTDPLNCFLTKKSSCNDWPKRGAIQMELQRKHWYCLCRWLLCTSGRQKIYFCYMIVSSPWSDTTWFLSSVFWLRLLMLVTHFVSSFLLFHHSFGLGPTVSPLLWLGLVTFLAVRLFTWTTCWLQVCNRHQRFDITSLRLQGVSYLKKT